MIQQRGIQGVLPDYEKEVRMIDEMILSAFKPKRLDGYEVQMIRQFEKACALLTKHMGIQTPEKLSVRKYYMRLADLKEQFKEAQPQQHQRNGRRAHSNK